MWPGRYNPGGWPPAERLHFSGKPAFDGSGYTAVVRALAVRSAGQVHLLHNYDLLGVSVPLEQQILAELQHHLGIIRQQCVLVATHTHSAPPAAPLEGEADPDPVFWGI